MKLLDCFLKWGVEEEIFEKILECVQVTVALDGPGSDVLKADIAMHAYARGIPAILQGDVARHFPGEAFVIKEHRTQGKYLDTFEVLFQAAVICENNGWTSIMLVAHPDHLLRCKLIAEHLGLKVYVPYASTIIPYSKKGDIKRDTIFGRHKVLNRPREIVARLRDRNRELI